MWLLYVALGIVAVAAAIVTYDLLQKKHAILHNFPILGHLRYLLESVGPELRQYIVTSNDEERPFSRDQRRWVYASSKKQNNYFGFGTDNEMEKAPNYVIVAPSAFPLSAPTKDDPDYDPLYSVPCWKVLGAARKRRDAFRPKSIVNVSGMSFGSLSGSAIEALNRGAKIAQCLHNTGEGGVSDHHRHGGDVLWQIGTGYFGCRADDGGFSMEHLRETVQATPTLKAIEIKLSQGAKPGLGGILPAAKITPEISRVRGIPIGQDCLSPPRHREFSDVDSMLDFVESIAEETGKPVGIKSAVGDLGFWEELARAMESGSRGVDYIASDGGEGGTGAGPLVFTDHVALPFRLAMSRVYRIFAERGLNDRVLFVGSAKLGFPHAALLALAIGADMVHVAREAMLAIGCIQAQKCHTGHCPAGVATQNAWLARGLDPTHKSMRLASYVTTLRKELLQLSHACGVEHPSLVGAERIEILDDHYGSEVASDVFGIDSRWALGNSKRIADVKHMMSGAAS